MAKPSKKEVAKLAEAAQAALRVEEPGSDLVTVQASVPGAPGEPIPEMGEVVPAIPAPVEIGHNAFHRQCLAATQQAALWAALAGLELMPYKLGLPHGAWIPWVEGNCEFTRRTATSYLTAAERAIKELGDPTLGSPSEMTAPQFAAIKARLVELLANDGLAEQRIALIAAIRPPALKKPAKPKRNTTPRPAGPRPLFSPKALPKMAERWGVTPPAVKNAFFDLIRDDVLAYAAA